MEFYHSEDASWALRRLQARISFSGWLVAMLAGGSLWALMFRLLPL